MCVLSQALVPRADGGGRVAAHEIMVLTPAIAHLIREGKIYRINSEIQTGTRYGMQLLDDALFALFKKRQIKYQDMMERAVNPTEMLAKVRESGLLNVGAKGSKATTGGAAAGRSTRRRTIK